MYVCESDIDAMEYIPTYIRVPMHVFKVGHAIFSGGNSSTSYEKGADAHDNACSDYRILLGAEDVSAALLFRVQERPDVSYSYIHLVHSFLS